VFHRISNWHYYPLVEDLLENGISDAIDPYEHRCQQISFFSRCLSTEEYIEEDMTYVEMLESKKDLSDYFAFEKKLIDFFIDISKKSKIVLLDIRSRPGKPILTSKQTVKWKQFDSPGLINKTITKGLREEYQYDFFLPEHHTIIVSNYDLTWPIFMLKPYSDFAVREASRHQLYVW